MSIAALIGVVALTAALVSAASADPSDKTAKAAKGGTYRVGWESTFGWTNSFDPTGEYLANGIAIYSNLLVAYVWSATTTSPAPPATSPSRIWRRRFRSRRTAGRRGRSSLKSGIRFGPPVNREITSKDVRVRDRATREAEERRPVRVLLQRDQGPRRLRQG